MKVRIVVCEQRQGWEGGRGGWGRCGGGGWGAGEGGGSGWLVSDEIALHMSEVADTVMPW